MENYEQRSDRGAYVPRVIVKFFDDVEPPDPAAGNVPEAVAGLTANSWGNLRTRFGIDPASAVGRYASGVTEEQVRAAVAAAQANTPEFTPVNFLNYYVITLPSADVADAVVGEASSWEGVESVEIEPEFSHPAFPTGANPRLAGQNYLDAAPVGIGVRSAWATPGGTGRGVNFIDLEGGWLLNHEDLTGAGATVIAGRGPNSARPDDRPHGTMALGVVVQQDNGVGGVGIAPDVSARCVTERDASGNLDWLGGLLTAIVTLGRGDVLLIELQTGPGPVESVDALFNAIWLATACGITVIEPAGNFATDLDAWSHPTRGHVFQRGHADFRDSGAIMVASCNSAVPHTKRPRSAFGSRIDCYAWGENVSTTLADASGVTNQYTPGFSGTSSASAIIAGVAIVFQSMVKARALLTQSPADIRAKLSNASNGTAPGAGQPAMGVMPDLDKLVRNEVSRYIVDDRPQVPSTAAALAFFDAGHGGRDQDRQSTAYGARGPSGALEKNVNLAIARRARERFGRGAMLSRDGDYNLSLGARLDAARRSGAPVYVALHANGGAPHQRGAEVWVYGRSGRAEQQSSLRLAHSIREELESIEGGPVPVHVGEMATLNPAYHRAGVAACLVEADYLTHPDGERRLTHPGSVDAIGGAVARGVQRYLGRQTAERFN